jgi:hypothetical protein
MEAYESSLIQLNATEVYLRSLALYICARGYLEFCKKSSSTSHKRAFGWHRELKYTNDGRINTENCDRLRCKMKRI